MPRFACLAFAIITCKAHSGRASQSSADSTIAKSNEDVLLAQNTPSNCHSETFVSQPPHEDVSMLLQQRVATQDWSTPFMTEFTKLGEEKPAALNTLQLNETTVKQAEKTASFLEGESSLLRSIMDGEVSKKSIEVVLARYAEDIYWSEPYKHVRTVYCKNEEELLPSCVLLPNVGREGHTYLYHIVNNYENLSDWTVFSQAQDPTIGYRGHRLGGGHLMPGSSFDSYVLPEEAGGMPRKEGAAFMMTGALSMSNLNHSLRLRYKQALEKPILHFAGACPASEFDDGWEKWWDLGWFKKYIGGRCGVPAYEVPKLFGKYWNEYVDLPWPQDNILFFTQGARFAASRERIRQRPLMFYQRLLDLLSDDKDPCWNYFNEWAWYYMIGAPTGSPCDTNMLLQQASNTSKMLHPKSKETKRKVKHSTVFEAASARKEEAVRTATKKLSRLLLDIT